MSARNSTHRKNHSSFKHSTKEQPDDGQQFAFKSGRSADETKNYSEFGGDAQTGADDYAFSKQKPEAAAEIIAEEAFRENLSPELTGQFSEVSNVESEIANQPFGKNSKKPKPADNWLARRGHGITYALLFLFTFVLYFRPYELIPGLSGLSSMAFILAIATIVIFVPSQLSTEGTLTARPSEVNYILLLMMFGALTIPIARSPVLAWEAFNDPFIKVVLMFIVMINVVRTKARLKALMWLALAVGIMLSIDVLYNYTTGNFSVEGYRAMANIKGMFGNPNAQAMHFVSITPIAVALAFAAKNLLSRLTYVALTVLFVAGNVVTFSRGGFLGLILVALVLAWKLGRESRFKVMLATTVIGLIFIAVAPGNYGLRILSIFIPGLDPVGSSGQRQDLLNTSILVTLRNPWGIGMMNFTLVNPRALVTHNSYTQVSAEMGVLALFCYLMLIITPFRRLMSIERELYEKENHSWIYYLAIGLQASIAGYAVSSFFDSAAYQWFLYYLVAYAVCLRRVYQISQEPKASNQEQSYFSALPATNTRLQTS
ncbi:MAG TPA: O-antigen ligase family protein [Pyrinomonadaceae bacterium]|nr:O-antigen ligase family protein [Pyrinomonadaceae bacterium]